MGVNEFNDILQSWKVSRVYINVSNFWLVKTYSGSHENVPTCRFQIVMHIQFSTKNQYLSQGAFQDNMRAWIISINKNL